MVRPLPHSELEQVLKNLYQIRSGYVHSLQVVNTQLRTPLYSERADYITWKHSPYLTFPGLVRLTHHVLRTYIQRQEHVVTENHPWRQELDGIIEGELAPQYWIWQANNFTPRQAHRRLSGFSEFMMGNVGDRKKGIPNSKELMLKIEKVFDQGKKEEKLLMFTHYVIYNYVIAQPDGSPNTDVFINKHLESVWHECSIQLLIALLFVDISHTCSGDDGAAAFERYSKQKYKESAVNLPVRMEVAIMLIVANL